LTFFKYSGRTDLADLIPQIIGHVAAAMGYNNKLDFLTEHISFVFGEWITTLKKSIESFPIQLFGFKPHKPGDLKAFLEKYISIILPKIIFLLEKPNLEFVAKTLQKEISVIITYVIL